MKILVIEDEEDLLNFTLTYLCSEGYVCEEASTFQEGLDKITMYDYDCVIADIGLPDGNGLNLVRQIKIIPEKSLEEIKQKDLTRSCFCDQLLMSSPFPSIQESV